MSKTKIIAIMAASLVLGVTYLHGQGKTTLRVEVGQPPLWVFSNVISANLHEPNCYLIRYVEGGVTNAFHAWMVPIKTTTNAPMEKKP